MEVGPHVCDHGRPQPCEPAIRLDGHLHVGVGPAPLRRRDKVLTAELDPLDRPSALDGQPRGERGLGPQDAFAAECAADIGHHDPDPVLAPAERAAQLRPGPVGILGGAPQREQICAPVVGGDGAPGLHGGGHDPGDVESSLDYTRGRLERRIDVPAPSGHPHEHVVPQRFVEKHVAGKGRPRVGHDLEGFILDLDERRRIGRRRGALAEHGRHRLPNVPDRPRGQDGVGDRGDLGIFQRIWGHGVDPAGQILRGHDGDDAGRSAGGFHIDLPQAGMPVCAAHHHEERHPGQHDVIDVLRLAAEEPRVLPALDRAADPVESVNAH